MKKKTNLLIIVICVIVVLGMIAYPAILKRTASGNSGGAGDKGINGSGTYMVGFDYSSYADVFGMAPVIMCRVRYDGTIDATYSWSDQSGEICTETKNYKISDVQFANIKSGVDLGEIAKLDPKCSDPEDVCDGGAAWLFLYGADDEISTRCGGFAPVSKRFNEIRRLLFDNLPQELIDDYSRFEEKGELY